MPPGQKQEVTSTFPPRATNHCARRRGHRANQQKSGRCASVQAQHRETGCNNAQNGPDQGIFEGYDDNAARLQFLASRTRFQRAVQCTRAISRAAHGCSAQTSSLAPTISSMVSTSPRYRSTAKRIAPENLRCQPAHALESDGMTLHSITGYESLDTFNRGDIDGGFGNQFATPMTPGFIPFSSEPQMAFPSIRSLRRNCAPRIHQQGRCAGKAGCTTSRKTAVESFSDSPNRNAQTATSGSGRKTTPMRSSLPLNANAGPGWKCGGLCYTHDKRNFKCRGLYHPASRLRALRQMQPHAIGVQGPDQRLPSDNKLSGFFHNLRAEPRQQVPMHAWPRFPRGQRPGSLGIQRSIGSQTETSTSFEAGIKSILNRQARVSSACLGMRSRTNSSRGGGGANANILLNAKKAEGQALNWIWELPYAQHAGYFRRKLQRHQDQGSHVGGGRLRRMAGDRPPDRARKCADRRQCRCRSAETQRQFHLAPYHSDGQRRALPAHGLGVPQQGQFLPVTTWNSPARHSRKVVRAWAKHLG